MAAPACGALAQNAAKHAPFHFRSRRPALPCPGVKRGTRTARAVPCSLWQPLVGQPRRAASLLSSATASDTEARIAEAPLVQGDNAVGISKLSVSDATAVLLVDPEAPPQPPAEQTSGADGASQPSPRVRLNSDALKQRKEQRQREQTVYKMSAIAASLGISSLAVAAVYYRFVWHMAATGADFPVGEAAATLLLTLGGAVGMEMWARYAHKALWHDFEPGWALHKSHHVPRIGPFEDNDVFAIINAVPAIALCAYGFLTPNVLGGVCFGAGLGITLFGISYMFIHDGLVHKRFPVGPIADVPYLKRVAIAHKLHHSEKYNGVPWGLFLGPQELEDVGGREELDRMVAEHDLVAKRR